MEYLLIALLLIAGLILIALEIFILPGLLTGIIGALFILGAIIFAFSYYGHKVGILIVLITIILILILVLLVRKFRIWNRFILKDESKNVGSKEGGTIERLIGKTGVALTDLRPSGFISIDNRKFDASSEGEFIPKNSKVKVLSITGMNIIVKKIGE